jgi:hypothetical protein
MSEYGYEVLGNSNENVISVLTIVGEVRDSEGNRIRDEHKSRIFVPGQVVPESEIAKHIIRKYEEGDEFTLATFRRVPIGGVEAPAEVKPEPKPKAAPKKETAKSQSAE